MGSNVSVEWAEITVCFDDRSMIWVKTNLTPMMKTKLYKYDNSNLYIGSFPKYYIIPIVSIKCLPSNSPDAEHTGLKIKLLLNESFLDDDNHSLVLHYVYQCDNCLSYYDRHVSQTSGTNVHARYLGGNELCLNSVYYNHPTKNGRRTLGLCISYLNIRFNLYRVFSVNHHIHGTIYLIYNNKGMYYSLNENQVKKITPCEASKKLFKACESYYYRENVDYSVHYQKTGCLYVD